MSLVLILITCAILVLIPTIIHHYKLYNLISGYSTLPREVRNKIDWHSFTLYFRNIYLITALLIILGWIILNLNGLLKWTPLMFILFILSGSAIIVIRGQALSKKASMGNSSYLRIIKNMNVLLLLIGGGSIVMISLVFYSGMKEQVIELQGDQIKISGIYSNTINVDDIIEIELLPKLQKVHRKQNGFALGNSYKGKFQMEDKNEVFLYVANSENEIIKITSEEGNYYINFKDQEKTTRFYKMLLEE